MACPTCGHTMGSLPGTDDDLPIFWCSRCGTLKIGATATDVPKLVERCREFEEWMSSQGKDLRRFYPEGIKEELHRLGIAESINKPGDRHGKKG